MTEPKLLRDLNESILEGIFYFLPIVKGAPSAVTLESLEKSIELSSDFFGFEKPSDAFSHASRENVYAWFCENMPSLASMQNIKDETVLAAWLLLHIEKPTLTKTVGPRNAGSDPVFVQKVLHTLDIS